jgi:hypothetical protein
MLLLWEQVTRPTGRGGEVEGLKLRPGPFFVRAEDHDAASNLFRVAARHGRSCSSSSSSSLLCPVADAEHGEGESRAKQGE